MMKHNSNLVLLALAALLFVACGDDSGDKEDAGGMEAASTDPLEYTGDFTMGETIAVKHKCLMSVVGGGMGDNISPALDWTGGPDGTMGYAIVLYDTRWSTFHWALWDIPAAATGVVEGIAAGYDVADPPGAHQVNTNGEPEYFGPCSDAGGFAGVYEYRLHALDTDALELTETSTPEEVQAGIEAASLEMVVWEGTPE